MNNLFEVKNTEDEEKILNEFLKNAEETPGYISGDIVEKINANEGEMHSNGSTGIVMGKVYLEDDMLGKILYLVAFRKGGQNKEVLEVLDKIPLEERGTLLQNNEFYPTIIIDHKLKLVSKS